MNNFRYAGFTVLIPFDEGIGDDAQLELWMRRLMVESR
jgi:hypothetical protein